MQQQRRVAWEAEAVSCVGRTSGAVSLTDSPVRRGLTDPGVADRSSVAADGDRASGMSDEDLVVQRLRVLVKHGKPRVKQWTGHGGVVAREFLGICGRRTKEVTGG